MIASILRFNDAKKVFFFCYVQMNPVTLANSGILILRLNLVLWSQRTRIALALYFPILQSRIMAETTTEPVIDTPTSTSEATGSEEQKYKVNNSI